MKVGHLIVHASYLKLPDASDFSYEFSKVSDISTCEVDNADNMAGLSDIYYNFLFNFTRSSVCIVNILNKIP